MSTERLGSEWRLVAPREVLTHTMAPGDTRTAFTACTMAPALRDEARYHARLTYDELHRRAAESVGRKLVDVHCNAEPIGEIVAAGVDARDRIWVRGAIDYSLNGNAALARMRSGHYGGVSWRIVMRSHRDLDDGLLRIEKYIDNLGITSNPEFDEALIYLVDDDPLPVKLANAVSSVERLMREQKQNTPTTQPTSTSDTSTRTMSDIAPPANATPATAVSAAAAAAPPPPTTPPVPTEEKKTAAVPMTTQSSAPAEAAAPAKAAATPPPPPSNAAQPPPPTTPAPAKEEVPPPPTTPYGMQPPVINYNFYGQGKNQFDNASTATPAPTPTPTDTPKQTATMSATSASTTTPTAGTEAAVATPAVGTTSTTAAAAAAAATTPTANTPAALSKELAELISASIASQMSKFAPPPPTPASAATTNIPSTPVKVEETAQASSSSSSAAAANRPSAEMMHDAIQGIKKRREEIFDEQKKFEVMKEMLSTEQKLVKQQEVDDAVDKVVAMQAVLLQAIDEQEREFRQKTGSVPTTRYRNEVARLKHTLTNKTPLTDDDMNWLGTNLEFMSESNKGHDRTAAAAEAKVLAERARMEKTAAAFQKPRWQEVDALGAVFGLSAATDPRGTKRSYEQHSSSSSSSSAFGDSTFTQPAKQAKLSKTEEFQRRTGYGWVLREPSELTNVVPPERPSRSLESMKGAEFITSLRPPPVLADSIFANGMARNQPTFAAAINETMAEFKRGVLHVHTPSAYRQEAWSEIQSLQAGYDEKYRRNEI